MNVFEPLEASPILDVSSSGKRLFFSLGNAEVQEWIRLHRLPRSHLRHYVDTCFKIACLLFDFVLQPTSHFYVPTTRSVSLSYAPLFLEGAANFVLGGDVEDYKEDFHIKRTEYPAWKDLQVDDNIAKAIIGELETLGPPIRRLGGIGNLTGSKWVETIEKSVQLIGNSIQQECKVSSKRVDAITRFLRDLPEIRGSRAFDWQYLREEIINAGLSLPPRLVKKLQAILLNCYLSACRELYGGYSITQSPIKFQYDVREQELIHQIDAKTFFDFSNLVGLSSFLENLSAADIVSIRRDMLYLAGFRRIYFQMIDIANGSASDALKLFKEELKFEHDTQIRCISSLMESSYQILKDAAKDCGLAQFIGSFMEPSDKGIFYLKNSLMEVDKVPFVAFMDEMRVNYSKRLLSRAKEIGRQEVGDRSTIAFVNCDFSACQFGSGNYFSRFDPEERIIEKKGEHMSEFTFSGDNKFEGCQFGDSNSMENFIDFVDNLGKSNLVSKELRVKGIELRKEIEINTELSSEMKKHVVNAFLPLFQRLGFVPKPRGDGLLQDLWNQMKQGVQTSAHLTTIIMAFGKLAGII